VELKVCIVSLGGEGQLGVIQVGLKKKHNELFNTITLDNQLKEVKIESNSTGEKK
jgi:hypothetical protein